ncbi:MAG: hypothetical protein HGB19_10790, partial [Chlorobiales bacterium]|nr:hypothetical protein [Chlorobiales bacterium]
PGWVSPFDENIELRRFADRTIRMEMPSHLLGKICWVSNLKYGEGTENKLTGPLALFLHEEGRNAGNARPSQASAKNGAEKIYAASYEVFTAWVDSIKNEFLTESEILTEIDLVLRDKMPEFESLYGGVKNYDVIGDGIFKMLAGHFAHVVIEDKWLLYDRLKEAWEAWLKANAGFQWCAEHVVKKIESALPNKQKDEAKHVAMHFGVFFSDEMRKNVVSGATIDDKSKEVERIFELAFPEEKKVMGFVLSAQQKNKLHTLFTEIYVGYIDVTMALWKVLLLLSKLHSVYPPATLHDCDDGNDENPVRLGSSMLGG